MLNHYNGPFIPVASAKVFHVDMGELMFEAEFLEINKTGGVLIADHV